MAESKPSQNQPDPLIPNDKPARPPTEGATPVNLDRKSVDVSAAGLGSTRDIAGLLSGWTYEPGTINVRRIVGEDGREKLQMRLDLGLLQMETVGRPDGTRPHGFESLLEFHENQLSNYRKEAGNEAGFALTRTQCESLRHEAAMYYQRYLSFFVLEEFTGVVRDTARNLRVLDLCGKYAENEQDRVWLEQYRPYILMMHARANAALHLSHDRPADAYRVAKQALKRIRAFFVSFQQTGAYKHSNEVKVLKKLARDIKAKLPVDPLEKLKSDLDKAVKAERYEEAAQLRDQIARLTSP